MTLCKRVRGESVDYILLSFFDGVGSAGLICSDIFEAEQKPWVGFAWETDSELVSLSHEKFRNIRHRGNIDDDDPARVVQELRRIDPGARATVIVAAGPPCHDHSRIRADAPGVRSRRRGFQVRPLRRVFETVESVLGLCAAYPSR